MKPDSRRSAAPVDETGDQPFHEALRAERLLAGLTQQALANLSNVSTRTIRDLEAGRANARIQTLHLLADALRLASPARESFVRAGLRNSAPGTLGTRQPGVAVPKPVNALLGRDREVRAMVDALASGRSRMISLSGLPGVGKTRVAAEVAAQLSVRSGWPVLWIGAEIGNRVRLDTSLSPVLRSLHSLIERNAAGMARVRQFLCNREALIVLDAIADTAGPFGVEELLASCPGVRVISTSRIPWQVAGLQSAVISPLPTPPGGQDADLPLEDLIRVPSGRLLLDRLSEVRPGFDLTPANARAAAEICRKLDGLPLALEAVARRFRVLSLPQLAEVPMADLLNITLPARPGVGEGPGASALGPETLAGLLGWSFRRQDTAGQAILRQLAAFEEGLTAVDVVRVLRRPVDVVLDELSVLIGSGLVLAAHGEPALLHVPNLLRALLQQSGGLAG